MFDYVEKQTRHIKKLKKYYMKKNVSQMGAFRNHIS
jgi:hypothetical protein